MAIKNPLAYISRNFLTKTIQYLTWLGFLAITWVILQYVFIGSSRAIPIIKTINIHIDEFKQHDVVMVQHQQLPFILIHRTPKQVAALKQKHPKADALRSVKDEYFIALAIGTDYGCIVLKHKQEQLKESCSAALYDYSGRSVSGNNDPLRVPKMTYNEATKLFNFTLK